MLDQALYRLTKSLAARRLLTPLLRSYLRYFPGSPGKEALWRRVVNPYLAWQAYPFVARTVFGRRIAGDTRDMIQQYVYYFGVWEPDLTAWISRQLRPGDVFVDVGANVGYYSLLAATLVSNTGAVIAIEASPTVFRQLEANLARNRAVNVRAVNVAASDQRGQVQLFRGPEHNLGETSVFQAPGFAPDGTVAAAPLGDILLPEELSRARLVKMDVEGAEAAVLAGFAPLLSACRRDLELIVELHPQYLTQPGRTAADLVQLMKDAGFCAYRIENDYWPVRPPSDLRRPVRLQSPLQSETALVFSRRRDGWL
jgi:FkbM family methyltransferase